MASYSITLFSNSGYNIINIPDTPSRLRADSTVDTTVPNVEILQNRHLSTVLISATDEQIKDADYIKIGDMYYAIASYTMQSTTTALLEIVEKPILSAGGFSVASDGSVTCNFDILDGVTSRCTVASDNWGQYTTEDPLTAPQEPLKITTEWLNVSGNPSISATISGDPICVETTVALPEQASSDAGVAATTYTDPDTGEQVTVPNTVPLPTVTGTGETQHTDFTFDGVTKNNGTAIYIKNDTHGTETETTHTAGQTIENGMKAVQSLGQENGSILNQYRIPRAMLSSVTTNYSEVTRLNGDTSNVVGVNAETTNITGGSGTISSTISPDFATVKNKRVLYGTYCKYGMITCAGNSAEFKPEDLGGETAPTISYKVDPRPDGKPYYRFSTINGDTDFWRNSLAGSTWENVPLTYQGKSGSALTRLNFDNERQISRLEREQYNESYGYRQARNITSGLDSVFTMGQGNALMKESQLYTGAGERGTRSRVYGAGSSLMNTGASGLLDSISGIFENRLASRQYEEMYNAQRANELSGLYQATEVYAPTVNFPYNADILRDVKNNGVCVYKYSLSDNDVTRIDKLLTMYGYKTAEPLTLANFGRRQKFDYVACSNVTVTNLPKWWCDDIADELKNGVRIWHTKPDNSAYDNNPIRS